MSKINDEMKAEAAAEARIFTAYCIALNLIKKTDKTHEEIAEICRLSLEDVEELAKLGKLPE